jgi:hypothetical protein
MQNEQWQLNLTRHSSLCLPAYRAHAFDPVLPAARSGRIPTVGKSKCPYALSELFLFL